MSLCWTEQGGVLTDNHGSQAVKLTAFLAFALGWRYPIAHARLNRLIDTSGHLPFSGPAGGVTRAMPLGLGDLWK